MWVRALMLVLACGAVGCNGALRRTPQIPSRRSVIASGLASLAGGVAVSQPACASLSQDLRDAEVALGNAQNTDEITAALENLRGIVEEYEGLPTKALTEELVASMRSKRSSLQGTPTWNGIPEEAYNGLMRKIDPWRTVELAPKLQYSIYASAPAYMVLIAVQQLVPKVFPIAYAGMAIAVLGPLVAQILVG